MAKVKKSNKSKKEPKVLITKKMIESHISKDYHWGYVQKLSSQAYLIFGQLSFQLFGSNPFLLTDVSIKDADAGQAGRNKVNPKAHPLLKSYKPPRGQHHGGGVYSQTDYPYGTRFFVIEIPNNSNT